MLGHRGLWLEVRVLRLSSNVQAVAGAGERETEKGRHTEENETETPTLCDGEKRERGKGMEGQPGTADMLYKSDRNQKDGRGVAAMWQGEGGSAGLCGGVVRPPCTGARACPFRPHRPPPPSTPSSLFI